MHLFGHKCYYILHWAHPVNQIRTWEHVYICEYTSIHVITHAHMHTCDRILDYTSTYKVKYLYVISHIHTNDNTRTSTRVLRNPHINTSTRVIVCTCTCYMYTCDHTSTQVSTNLHMIYHLLIWLFTHPQMYSQNPQIRSQTYSCGRSGVYTSQNVSILYKIYIYEI